MKMRKYAAWILAVCMLLAGCQSAGDGQNAEGAQPEPGEVLSERFAQINQQVKSTGKVEFEKGGIQRIRYNGAVSTVKYITSVDQLPDYDVFKQYDAAFFQDKALVLVTQSTGSGSIRLEIDSLSVEDGEVKVKLKQTAGGDVSTSDMAAWLLWVEVSAGLELEWDMDATSKVMNPGQDNNPGLVDK